jgi:hypothetical protein
MTTPDEKTDDNARRQHLLKTQTTTQVTTLDYGIPYDEADDNSEDSIDVTTPDDYTDGQHRLLIR